ncbi:GNAT family N-acetyltransferase [Metabacillus idriensis]|uniref:GNAT family N-acetyltransferase n=1 Tax=Metabacillus idriensis TaxID=324768 RepID=UPI002812EB6C|nr:GNAT family N-acetyltransferase [Metabacillus idriensis]MDR0139570.1 GNAT family N-acetyltransferase [Metabacillus idriensis]
MLTIENFDGELVGRLNTDKCDPRNGTFSYGISLFREHWKKGYASDAIKVLLRYFFNELR